MGDLHADDSGDKGILKEFASYSFVFVPTFVIFAIESVWSLKIRQAVQKLPPPPDQLPKCASPAKWHYRGKGTLAFPLYMIAIMVWGLKMDMSDKPEPDTDSFYLVSLTPTLVIPLGNIISIYLGFSHRVVSRSPSDPATVHAKNAEKFGTLLCSIPYALALLLAIASFVFKSRVLLAIDIAAITHFFVSKSVPQVIVGKYLIIAAVSMFVYVFTLTAAVSSGRHTFTISNDIFPEPQDGQSIVWPRLILLSFSVVWPFTIIAFCYRFDYFNSVSPGSLMIPLDAEADPDAMIYNGDSTKATVTVQSPGRGDFRFPKPYFFAALMGWLASFLLLALFAVIAKADVEPILSGFILAYLSPAVMAIFIGLVSISRKDSKSLWKYKEDWFIEPKPALDEEAGFATSVEYVEPKLGRERE